MWAGKPSLSALGLGGKIFPPSLLLLGWLSGQLGSASIGTYQVADSIFNCLALVHGCLNSVDCLWWSHQQNSLAVPPAAATVPGSCWDVLASPCSHLYLRKSAASLPNWRITCFSYLGGEKAQTNQQKHPLRSQSISVTPQEGRACPGPSCVNPSGGAHSVRSSSGIFC